MIKLLGEMEVDGGLTDTNLEIQSNSLFMQNTFSYKVNSTIIKKAAF